MNLNLVCYSLLLLTAVGSALLPYPLAMWFLLSSLLTWLIYGADKLAARKAWRRVPETTLLVLGLAGGWPGAILGQQCFRHKTQKQPFRTRFFISVALNVAALAGLYVVYTQPLSGEASAASGGSTPGDRRQSPARARYSGNPASPPPEWWGCATGSTDSHGWGR